MDILKCPVDNLMHHFIGFDYGNATNQISGIVRMCTRCGATWFAPNIGGYPYQWRYVDEPQPNPGEK
jgi:hypothetical protein